MFNERKQQQIIMVALRTHLHVVFVLSVMINEAR